MAINWGDAAQERPTNIEHRGLAIDSVFEAIRSLEVRLRAAVEAQRDEVKQGLADVRERLERIEDSVEELKE